MGVGVGDSVLLWSVVRGPAAAAAVGVGPGCVGLWAWVCWSVGLGAWVPGCLKFWSSEVLKWCLAGGVWVWVRVWSWVLVHGPMGCWSVGLVVLVRGPWSVVPGPAAAAAVSLGLWGVGPAVWSWVCMKF